MKKVALCLMSLMLLISLQSCQQHDEYRAEFFVFGTLLEVIVRDAERESANRAFGELQQRFQAMHRDWHAWEPGALTGINQAFAAGETVDIPADIADLIVRSQSLETLTAGRFNAAIGALIELWGFHTSTYPVTGPLPEPEAIQALLVAAPSSNDIHITDGKAFSSNPAVQLDFGAIAKGRAVDIAIEILAHHGISNAMVNAGGDLRAIGGTLEMPWSVGVRRPGGGISGGVEIIGSASVFTSGGDQRFRQRDGLRYPHILDPVSGLPTAGIASVTVITDDASFADVAATALVVAGQNGWKDLMRDLGLAEVMVIDDDGEIFVTPQMKMRLLVAPGSSESFPGQNLHVVSP